MMFKCPECGSNLLYEQETGPVLTRCVTAIDSNDKCTLYKGAWISEDKTKWWYCGGCKCGLPVDNVEQLIEYLEKLK